MSEGFVGAATILEIISRKHNVYPNLATVFLDVDFAHADFQDRYLRSCWGTVTRRMRRNWLQVLDTAERTQIYQRVRHQFHAVVSLLDAFKAEQQPLELVLPGKGPLNPQA